MTPAQKRRVSIAATVILAGSFFYLGNDHRTGRASPSASSTSSPSSIAGKPATSPLSPALTQGSSNEGGESAIRAAKSPPPPEAEISDPARLQAARAAFSTLIKTWEGKNTKPLKGTPGAATGGMTIMYLPPMDAATKESAIHLLDQYDIPADGKNDFFERNGPLEKHRYVGYSINPADTTGAKDTMWIAYVDNINSVRIDPFTGDLVIAPEKPGDGVGDLRLKDGMQRYSHLFSFSDTAE